MRTAQSNQGVDVGGAAETRHQIATNDAPLGVANDGNFTELEAVSEGFQFGKDILRDIRDAACVHRSKPPPNANCKHIVAIVAQTFLKDVHAPAGAAEALNQQNRSHVGFFEIGNAANFITVKGNVDMMQLGRNAVANAS